MFNCLGILKWKVLVGRSKIRDGRGYLDVFSLVTFILHKYLLSSSCVLAISANPSKQSSKPIMRKKEKVGQWPVCLITSWEIEFLSSCLHSHWHLSGWRVPFAILLKELFFLLPARGTLSSWKQNVNLVSREFSSPNKLT